MAAALGGQGPDRHSLHGRSGGGRDVRPHIRTKRPRNAVAVYIPEHPARWRRCRICLACRRRRSLEHGVVGSLRSDRTSGKITARAIAPALRIKNHSVVQTRPSAVSGDQAVEPISLDPGQLSWPGRRWPQRRSGRGGGRLIVRELGAAFGDGITAAASRGSARRTGALRQNTGDN
jgi:hypothetical protein